MNSQSTLTYREWMGKPIYLSKRNIKSVPETIWKWNSIGKLVSWDVITSLPEKPWDWDNLSSRKGLDLQFVKEHPDFSWNWAVLSKHKDLTMEMITSLPQKPWDYSVISGSSNNITLEDFLQHSELAWDWKILTQRVTSVEIMKRFPDKNWDWEWFSEQGKFNIQEVVENPGLPWVWNNLSHHLDMKWDIIKLFLQKDWCWSCLSACPIITLDIIMKYPKQWSWSNFSKNPSLTADMVRNNRMMPWDFKAMSYNQELVGNDKGIILLDFKDCEWDWFHISTYISYDFIYTYGNLVPLVPAAILAVYTDKLWSFIDETATMFNWPWEQIVTHEKFDTEAALMLLRHYMSDIDTLDLLFELGYKNVNLIEVAIALHKLGFDVDEWCEDLTTCNFWSFEYVVKHPDMPWNWDELSSSKKTTMEDIDKHMNLPWDFWMVSENENLTWQFIIKHPSENWDQWTDVYRREMDKMIDFNMQEARTLSRTSHLKESIVASALHPTRFMKYLESYNYDMSDEKYI